MRFKGLEHPIHVVGLTGGIGSGKSTVANLFRKHSHRVNIVDADFIARLLVAPGEPALTEIVKTFGRSVLCPTGLDRKKLGRIVFGDPAKLKKLNKIMGPRIQQRAMTQIEWWARRYWQDDPVIIYEAALLVESGTYKQFDRLIVVGCDHETQRQRVMARDKCTEAEARERIAAQYPLGKKKRVCSYFIDTSCPLNSVKIRVAEVFNLIVNGRRR
jgi:dephospho-CoA kinase